ncbi:hypothetical protein HGRIS_001928 [Hohenbuehelia grisea]|uniref:Glycoside hydrolase family 71 protein n=1 Tax=Hohenbuehelia grisea TaxID=104357 RepID=A0ABR3JJX7_9AGAR
MSSNDVDQTHFSAPAAARMQGDRKFVFAHFMVGNTFPYSINDWAQDVEMAAAHEIDGFALNIGREDWQKQRVADCFEAVTRSSAATSFKLFFSFDMSSFPGNSPDDINYLLDYMRSFGHHPCMHRQDGKVLVSTFSGENALFGRPSLEDGWNHVKAEFNSIVPTCFMPSFFIDPARYKGMPFLDGVFNWNGGWPIYLNPSMPRQEIEHFKLDTDFVHISNLGIRSFMAAVSPWFFTHYGPDTWNKNWIYRADDWLYVRRWKQLIELRNRIDIAQIITWNDYGESHYIGPIHGAQPNSQAWVDGFDHHPWLQMTKYFAHAFKYGEYPAITEDRIFMWARPHPKGANAPEHVPRPNNWELTDDVFWVVVFAKAPGVVNLSTTPADLETHNVAPGVSTFKHALKPGEGMKAVLHRGNNRTVGVCHPSQFRFEPNPAVYNFNAFTAAWP